MEKLEDPLPLEENLLKQSTEHDHYYFWGMNNNNLREVMCNCGHGMQVEEANHKIEGGKLISFIL